MMKLLFAYFGLLVVGNYVVADSCGKDGEECLEALYQAFSDSVGTIIDCRNMKASISCLEDVSGRCLTGEEKENIDGQIYKLRRDVDGICPRRSHVYYRPISEFFGFDALINIFYAIIGRTTCSHGDHQNIVTERNAFVSSRLPSTTETTSEEGSQKTN